MLRGVRMNLYDAAAAGGGRKNENLRNGGAVTVAARSIYKRQIPRMSGMKICSDKDISKRRRRHLGSCEEYLHNWVEIRRKNGES